jgi:long-chain acyl-CoA synthetase
MARQLDWSSLVSAPASAPAVVHAEGELTYGQLRVEVQRCQAALSAPAKALLLVAAPRTLPGMVAYLAALAAGHAVILIEDNNPARWQSLISAFEPDYIVVTSSETLDSLIASLEYRLVPTASLPVWAREGSNATVSLHPDLALLMQTSGSLGPPKSVRISYENLRSNAVAIAEALALRRSDRAVTSLPLDFSFGLSLANSAFAAGASLAMTRFPLASGSFLRYLDYSKATYLGAVPSVYQAWRRNCWDPGRHPSLRLLLQAGGALDRATVAHFASIMKLRGGSFIPMYGQTEATARMTYLPASLALSHPDSVGVPIPGSKIEIRSTSGIEIDAGELPRSQDGEVGEILFSGPGVALGYATCRDDLALGPGNQTTLRTGDLGYVRGGLLYVTGRADRQVKILGRRVDLDQIESEFRKRGIVVAVEAVDGDRLAVVAEPVPDLRGLRRWLSHELKLPVTCLLIVSVPKLPFNDRGKVDRMAIQKVLHDCS